MNETFKNQLAAFARDTKAICDANSDTCEHCPMCSHGLCVKPFVSACLYDLDAAIAAVEAYRKHKKPCAEVIDRCDDIVELKVTAHRYRPNTMCKDVSTTARYAKMGIEYTFGHIPVDVEIISAKRFVLESHRESDGDKE